MFDHGEAQFSLTELNNLLKLVKGLAAGFSEGGRMPSGRRTLIPKANSDTLTTFMVVELVI